MLGILYALGAALCWAIAPILFATGLKDVSANSANILRLSVAGIFAFVAAILWEDFWNQWPFDWAQIVIIIALTFIGMGFGDWLYLKGLKSTDVSFIVGISNIYPLFVAFFAILFGTESFNFLTFLASIIIVFGVILVSITNNTNVSPQSESYTPYPESWTQIYKTTAALMILAAFTWGITIYGLGFSLQYFPPFSANAIRMLAVAGLLGLSFLHRPTRKTQNNPQISSWAILIIGSVIGPGIGAWMMLVALDLLGPTKSSAIFSVSPFFTAWIAILVLKEKLTLIRFGGIILVCIGVILISIY